MEKLEQSTLTRFPNIHTRFDKHKLDHVRTGLARCDDGRDEPNSGKNAHPQSPLLHDPPVSVHNHP
jgi:hypothetical protein